MGRGWVELAEGVFYRRHESVNVNVGLVLGGDGTLVVDTRASPRQGREVVDAVRAVTALPVRWVVNTHSHWDHTFGNAAFAGAEIWAHPACRDALVERADDAVREAASWEPSLAADLEGFTATPPDHLVGRAATLDIGGRRVLLEHLGRGHTDSDIVVRVPGSGVVFAGDLLESGAPPWFGDGFPLSWPATAAAIDPAGSLVAVPGHGPPMDGDATRAQVGDLTAVAAVCARALASGRGPAEADLSGSPYPEDTMRSAVARALVVPG
jgi:glyoxylase-like metal-dependent hydrolase (beta-lactamase superfamily II)